MQNRVELRQKGMITAEKQCIAKRGKYHFWTKTYLLQTLHIFYTACFYLTPLKVTPHTKLLYKNVVVPACLGTKKCKRKMVKIGEV
jgi:hypothetical protein